VTDQSEVQSGSVPFAFFDSAQQADTIILSENDERAASTKDARIVRLSTGGLSRALGALQPHCGEAGRGA
jgi:hypothetical protein